MRAAAALATGAFEQESIVARVAEMRDEAAVREHLRQRLPRRLRVPAAGPAALDRAAPRASGARRGHARATAQHSLAEGMRSILDAGERVRLISGLRAFQGEQSRGALLQVIRGDPSAEVRTAALTAVGSLLDSRRAAARRRPAARWATRACWSAGRRSASSAGSRPSAALPGLLRALRADDDPAVLAGVAELAEAAFEAFVDLALGDAARRAGRRCWSPRWPATSTTPSCRRSCRRSRGASAPAVREAVA